MKSAPVSAISLRHHSTLPTAIFLHGRTLANFLCASNTVVLMQSALMEMDVKDLENEHRSLKADKAGELEYLQSLEARIDQLKVFGRIFFLNHLMTDFIFSPIFLILVT